MHKEVYKCIRCNSVIASLAPSFVRKKVNIPIHCIKCEDFYTMQCAERMAEKSKTRGIERMKGLGSVANYSMIDD